MKNKQEGLKHYIDQKFGKAEITNLDRLRKQIEIIRKKPVDRA